jgi:hypothetical protein
MSKRLSFGSEEQGHSVHDGLISEHMHLTIKGQSPGGMELSHEDDDHLLFWVDGEPGAKKTSPAELTSSPEFGKRRFHPFNAETKLECLVLQLIVAHELNRPSLFDASLAGDLWCKQRDAGPRLYNG